jgi:Prion-inhibition and propagation
MVDPLGAALGVGGLAGLFGTVVQCVQLVSLGKSYARDIELLQTRFEAQKVRLLIWGEAVGIVEKGVYDTRLDSPTIQPTVFRILNNIRLLFSDEQDLGRKYGLLRVLRNDTLVRARPAIFAETYHRFQARLSKTLIIPDESKMGDCRQAEVRVVGIRSERAC